MQTPDPPVSTPFFLFRTECPCSLRPNSHFLVHFCALFSYLRRERTSTLAVTIKISFKRFPSSFHDLGLPYSVQYNFFPALRLATGAAAAERWSGGAERSQTSFFLMFVRGGRRPSPGAGIAAPSPLHPRSPLPLPRDKAYLHVSSTLSGVGFAHLEEGEKVAIFLGLLREMLCARCSTRIFFLSIVGESRSR